MQRRLAFSPAQEHQRGHTGVPNRATLGEQSRATWGRVCRVGPALLTW